MDFKKASLTGDAVIFRIINGKREVLLIRRKRLRNVYGGYWAIPGGFVDLGKDEQIEDATYRELNEETGLDLKKLFKTKPLKFFNFYDAPKRDPRGRTISFIYIGEFANKDAKKLSPVAADDAEEVKWWDIYNLPKTLAFDHNKILDDIFEHLQLKSLQNI